VCFSDVRSVKSSSSQYPIVTWNVVISLAVSVRPTCVSVIRPMCARISLISHSSCLTALTDVGNVHMRDPSSCSSRDCFPMCLMRSLQMPWCTAILGFCKALQSRHSENAGWFGLRALHSLHSSDSGHPHFLKFAAHGNWKLILCKRRRLAWKATLLSSSK